MTCSKCKHSREIARLADFPDERERARLRDICSKCTLSEELPGDGSVSLDAIVDGTAERILNVAPNRPTFYTFDHGTIDDAPPEESDAATGQSEDARETLRKFLYAVTGLDVLSFVAALHFARRGGRRRLAATIRQFAADIRSYKNQKPSKAVICWKWKSLKAKVPELAVLGTLIEQSNTRRASND